MGFADLKKSSAKNFEKLREKLEKIDSGGNNYQDDRYWQPTVDSAGNGYAVIRFLPTPEGEDIPFVRLWTHAFKGPTGLWYIENCRSTLDINEPDPVMQLNNQLWNSTEDDKSPERKQARDQKRKLNYISNILVVNDPDHPENNGKVFLFKYGKKIYDKIKDAMYPEEKFGEEPFDPFDFWGGANFRLKIRKVEGYRNYDASSFDKPEALSDDDEFLEGIYNKLYSLQAEIAPDKFKPYDKLKEQLDRVLGLTSSKPKTEAKKEEPREIEEIPEAKEPAFKEKENETFLSNTSTEDEDDDDLDFFKQLADD